MSSPIDPDPTSSPPRVHPTSGAPTTYIEAAVILSLITFEDREHRDEVKAAVMADGRMGALMGPEGPPFDPSRMVGGGFEVLIEG